MADERDAEQGGGDLFDRWLAHREESTDDAPRPRTYGVPRTARAIDEGVETSADGPASEPDEPAVEPMDPPAPETPAETAEVVDTEPHGVAVQPEPAPVEPPTPRREPMGLGDFEPVVIASVRRSAEAPSQRRGRRARRAPEPVDTPVDTPGEAPDGARVEEPVEDEPTPLHDQVAEEVPLPELPPEPAPGPAPTTRRTRPALSSYVDAARTSLDRSVRGTPEERAPEPSVPAPPAPTPPAPAPTPGADPVAEAGRSRSAYDGLRVEREAAAPPLPDRLPPDVDFTPRTLARRVTSVLLLLGLVATGYAAWRGYDSRVETDIGLAAILALITGIVWAVRAGTVPTRVSLHGGHLEVRTQAGRFVFEITGAHTRLENVGTPGRRGWKLLVHRRGLAPFAITAAMVDPRDLLEALRYYRPDL